MVRSKFPGKPSKIVNRKVVKSSKYCVLHDNESSKAAENISYGLAVFNETFGDHEQGLTAFHGFSPHEVDRARETAKKQQEKVQEEYEINGLTFSPEDPFPVRIDPPTPQILSMVEANLSLIGPVGSHTTRAQYHSFHSEEISVDFSKAVIPPKCSSPFRSNFKKHVANRLLQRAKKAMDVSSSNRFLMNLQLDKNGSANASGLVRKFVLPSRSVHSSRVIKPNKRFLDVDDPEKNTHPDPTLSGLLSHSRVIELKKPRLILDKVIDFSLVRPDDIKSTTDGLFSSSNESSCSDVNSKEHVKLDELNVFGAPTTRPKRRISQSSTDGSPKKDGSSFPPSATLRAKSAAQLAGPLSPSRSKLILRESKLNISAAAEKLAEGVFSKKPKKGLTIKVLKSPGPSLECGVCSAVGLHSFTKQAVKFGLFCCDACRKFITKMVLRSRSSDNSVPCEKGQGNCAVSSPSLKDESFASKVNRCWACWLLLCIQRLLKMPEKIRDSLIRMLPANMQGMTVVIPPVTVVAQLPNNRNRRRKGRVNRSVQDLSSSRMNSKQSPKPKVTLTTPSSARKLSTCASSKRVTHTPIARIKRKAALVSLANNMRRTEDQTSPGTVKKVPISGASLEKAGKIKKLNLSKKSEVHSKSIDKSLKEVPNKNSMKNKDGQMRQKLSLKGPRVKHVCRSASVVLGQPIATFPIKSSPLYDNDASNDVAGSSLAICDDSDLAEEKLRPKEDVDAKETRCKLDYLNSSTVVVKAEEKSADSEPSSTFSLTVVKEAEMKLIPKCVVEAPAVTSGRRITRPVNDASNQNKFFQRGQRRTLQDLSVLNSQVDAVPELVSLDFWESYDPEEVCNSGFGLIGFDPFYLKPVCFLCGSAGKKKLIHCASCCEPYHQFCVEMGVLGGPGPLPLNDQANKDEWRVDWVCPRCTVCHGCGHSTGQQLTSCQRCHHSYHLQCLGTTSLRKSAGDRLWICSSCLRCKSCNTADVTKFVGNLPFCKVCFKLRQKGNFCPLCQGCYADDDYQSKMMECAECKAWVHAKCEGLSDEKYQVLSYLPESVEFICRLCCVFPPAPWWVAVESELQAGYNNIIKSITKNRKAYAMLKWSPQKSCDCMQRPVVPSSKMVAPAVALGKRRLSFNSKAQDQSKEEVLNSTISNASSQRLQPDNRSVAAVFEFDDDVDGGENAPITRYSHTKDKSKTICVPKEYANLNLDCGNDTLEKANKGIQLSPNAGSQSDSGVGSTDDELKTFSAAEEEDVDERKLTTAFSVQCICANQNLKHPSPTLLTVKKKVQSNQYSSIIEFHQDMDLLIREADSHEVKELYHQTLQEVFPWFDPKYDKVHRNSLPLSPCKPHHGSLLQYHPTSTSPEKHQSKFPSSFQILQELLPKDGKKLDDSYFYSGISLVDSRICSFCKLVGDSEAFAEGRLLYCGQNEWVHVNCALWSAEVFEEIDGALQNVNNALSRGRMIRCSECGKKGASVGCCAKKCEETLHFPCARKAGFVFMEDKNVYCSLHMEKAPGKPLTKLSDFDICRPVFVELDRRKRKCIEGKHVRLMIGSLLVESLGNIAPDVSDQGSSIVPAQFCCTRLFWSSKEPWRIVRYTIRTTVHVPTSESVEEVVHHVTVDHSKECPDDFSGVSSPVERPKEKEKKNDIICKSVSSKIGSVEKISACQMSDDAKVVEAVISHLLDAVSSKEVDEEVSDAQNSADLLPPELKDAIFEDLPHDLLDGISMQDIFQDKFLNFEELGKDDAQEDSSANGSTKFESSSEIPKRVRSFIAKRELKRSKSDVLPSNSSQTDSRLHQRSCSLAWSCKLGANISCCKAPRVASSDVGTERTKLIQELRLSVKPASSSDLRYCLQVPSDKGKENQSLSWPRIMQVDGISDAVLSDDCSDVEVMDPLANYSSKIQNSSQCSSFPSNLAEDSELLRNRIECLRTVTSAALSGYAFVCGDTESRNQSNRNKRRKSFNKVYGCRKGNTGISRKLQIPQVDGANDLSSDSEHDFVAGKSFQEQSDEKPVSCSRCGCTYRTEESYTRHLPNCSGDYSLTTTSESEADISGDEEIITVSAPSPDSAISVSSGSHPIVAPISPSGILVTSSAPSAAVIASGTITTQSSKSQGDNYVVSTVTTGKNTAVSKLVPSSSTNGNVKKMVSKVQRTLSVQKAKTTKLSTEEQTVKLVMKRNQSVFHQQQVFEQSSHQQITHHPVQYSLATSMPQQSQQNSQVITMLDYQQSQQSTPTVFVQSVPSPAMVPAYLEAFQQHTGQNLQYLATVDTNGGYGKAQYLAAVPSSVVPGAYELQTITDGQLCMEPSALGISTLSGIQLAQAQLAPAQIAQTQPQVLGTLLQSPLSCGVVTTSEPVFETIQMYPDQSGGVILASQPMLTCMETVVSNTVMSMSSSQFVSSSVPGMLQGSSTYSTTTTQVYQANKVDTPVLDVPTQYVVVNTQPQLPKSTVGELEVVSLPQSHIQEQTPIQSQTKLQLPSINLPVPVTVAAPLPPQTLPPLIPLPAVNPVPRMQVQRTYSKPNKLSKDSTCAVSRSSVPPVTCTTVREAVKAAACRVVTKKLASSSAICNSLNGSGIKPNLVDMNVKKTCETQQAKQSVSSSVLVEDAVSSPELISAIIAPAQSITLPDPVRQSSASAGGPNSSEVVSASPPAPKRPPVTFSYRSHIAEMKQNPTSTLTKAKVVPSLKKPKMKSPKQDNLLIIASSTQPFVVKSASSNDHCGVPPTSGSSAASSQPISSRVMNSQKNIEIESISGGKASEETGASACEPLLTESVVLNTDGPSGAPNSKTSICNSSLPQSTPASVRFSTEAHSVGLNQPPNHILSTPPPPLVPIVTPATSPQLGTVMNSTPTTAPQNEVGITAIHSTSVPCTIELNTSCSASTTSINPSQIVTTTKSVNSNAAGLKPLKEINYAHMISDSKPIASKIQDRSASSIPPAVLKSASPNVDSSKRNDGFCSQSEIPLLFQCRDNSPASLKLLFQKQAHNGCYKVSSSPGKKDGDLVAVKLADISVVSNGMKDKIKVCKDESENVKPVEKPRKGESNSSAPELIYEIQCQDGFSYSSASISDAWQKVFGAVQEARANHKMPPLLHNPFNSVESAHNVMGLGNNSLKYLLEQLPGVGDCTKYRPIYHKSRLPNPGYLYKRQDRDNASKESQSGCARTEPYLSAKKYDMFSWLDSRHRCPPKLLENTDIDSLTGSRRATSTSLPMAMRFRYLRETSKTSVGVFRSDIHGRGLFCLRDIEAGEMVIEYAGEVIRNTLTDNREKYYQSKGIGCYMFKVDDNFTVDATQKGNAARFINHSCEPNCYSRVVDILGKKHIIIFALRRIPQGEELTYDYKFPIEDEKIHCHCLARRCRKYLN